MSYKEGPNLTDIPLNFGGASALCHLLVYRWVSAQIAVRAILPAPGFFPALWEHEHSPKARKGRLKAGLQAGLPAPQQMQNNRRGIKLQPATTVVCRALQDML